MKQAAISMKRDNEESCEELLGSNAVVELKVEARSDVRNQSFAKSIDHCL